MCETGLVLSEITHMLKNIRSYAKEKTVPTPLAQFHSHSFRKPSPYGVVLVMSPWNYPFLLTIEPLVDAIAAGNTVILKPSAYSPATSEVIRTFSSMNVLIPSMWQLSQADVRKITLFSVAHFDYIFLHRKPACWKRSNGKSIRTSHPGHPGAGRKKPLHCGENCQSATCSQNELYSENI